jgi:hypothetical protein
MSIRHRPNLIMRYPKPLIRRSAGTSLRMNLEMSIRHRPNLIMRYPKPLIRRSAGTSLRMNLEMSIGHFPFSLLLVPPSVLWELLFLNHRLLRERIQFY